MLLAIKLAATVSGFIGLTLQPLDTLLTQCWQQSSEQIQQNTVHDERWPTFKLQAPAYSGRL